MRPKDQEPATARTAVRNVMRTDVMAVRDDMTVPEAAAFLVENQISGAPVEDSEGRLIGVLSYADIARAASEARLLDAPMPDLAVGAGFYSSGWDDRPEPETLPDPPQPSSAWSVRDIMTPKLFSVPEEAPVVTAARMMLDAHIHRVLVTRDHKVVGILTAFDLLELLVDAG
jgi:CBS domain-containing protein